MRRSFSAFLRDAGATSALEFAMMAPILIGLAMGSIELQRYQRIARQLLMAAENIAEVVAQRETEQPDPLNFDFNIALPLFPQAYIENVNWHYVISHQISHARFRPTVAGCVKDCTYQADLIWNWPTYDLGPGAGDLRRKCGPLAPAPDGSAPNGATLPQSMFGPGTVIVVDLRYAYKPIFGASLFKPVIMERQAFSFPRFASPYVKATGGSITNCPGFT